MKKLYSLLACFVLFAANAAAQFTPTTFKEQGFDLSKGYNITCVRGSFKVTTDGWSRINPGEMDPGDQNQMVQFVEQPVSADSSNYYLYSPTNGKYLSAKNTWVKTQAEADPIYLFTTTYTKDTTDPETGDVIDTQVYPYGLAFSPDYTSKGLMVTGSMNIEVDPTWTTPDDGDAFQITVSEVDPSTVDLVASLQEKAIEKINTLALNPTLYSTDDVDNAVDEVYAAKDEDAINAVVFKLKKSAEGKPFTLHSQKLDGRPYGYLRDNGTALTVDSLSFESEFQVEYVDSVDQYNLKNIYTGNYVSDVVKSEAVKTGDTKALFNINPKDNSDDQTVEKVVIGQTDPACQIHNGGGYVLGWYDTANEPATTWILAPYEATEAVKSVIENVNSKIGTRWGDYANTEAFQALKANLEANPTKENYEAVLNTDQVVSPNAFVNIHSTYKTEDGVTDYTNLSISLSQVNNDQIVDTTYQHIQALDTDNEDPYQIWKVTSVKQGYVRLYSPEAKKYIGPNVNYSYNSIALSDEPVDWQIIWVAPDTFQLKNNDDNMNIENADQYMGNLNHWHGRDTWTAVNINTLPITASTAGDKAYTTVCYPFDLTLDKGTAYKAKVAADGKTVERISLGNTIPAGTPAIIETEAADKNIIATINGLETSAELNEPGYIQGTYFPLTVTPADSILAFGVQNDVPGFYHFNRLINNGAYLISNDAQDAVTLGEIVTGINNVNVDKASANAPRYNLAGQRVDKDYKGVIIVNGKKFFQK